ncbi:MAG: YCF48-related protein, partial [Bacteroidota bacterium]|nr:YCF48-related protein [Bacteroidota bacterium]
TDPNTGTAVGNGAILHTTDAGTTWTLQSEVNETLYGVHFTDAYAGTAVGTNGAILRTTNAGTTWSNQTSGVNTRLWGVTFTSPNVGTVVGSSGVILHTTNGGLNWSRQTSGTTNDLYGVSFTDANTGSVAGLVGTILRTTDGGSHWIKQTVGDNRDFSNVFFLDANNGFLVGNGIFRTTNGGATWINQSTNGYFWGVYFSDKNNGTVVGTGQMIIHTTDAGTTWTFQRYGEADNLIGVVFTDKYTGTAVGNNGMILHTTTGGSEDTAAQISVAPNSVKFGKVKADSSTLRTVVIHNTSLPNFQLKGTASGVQPPFTLLGAPVSFNIKRGDSTVLTLAFSPTASGNFFDTLLIASNTDQIRQMVKVNLSGIGTPSDIMAHPATSVPALDFGFVAINKSLTDTLRISNTGDPSITWTAEIEPLKPLPSPFSIPSGGGNPVELAGGARRTVFVKFLPRSFGTFYDTLRIVTLDSTNVDAAHRTISVPIKGIGFDPSGVDGGVTDIRKLEAFPNPASDICHVEFSLNSESTVQLTVFDELGAEVMSINKGKLPAGDHVIDLSIRALVEGNYFCRLQTASQEQFVRIVVTDSRK